MDMIRTHIMRAEFSFPTTLDNDRASMSRAIAEHVIERGEVIVWNVLACHEITRARVMIDDRCDGCGSPCLCCCEC